MKFVTISYLALAVAAVSELNVMNSVSVPRDAYTALTSINAAFQLPETNGQSAIAGLTMKTTKPTLNLANFEHVSEITCLDNEIQIVFDDAAHLKEAHDEWSTTSDLTLLVPHENKCHGNDGMASYSVKKIDVEGLKMLVDFEPIPVASVVDTFTLEVVQTKGSPAVSKRGLLDWLNWSKENTDVHTYEFNYDANTGKAIQSPIQFAVSNSNKFFCTECYASGKSGIHTVFKGSALAIESYEIDLFGDFKVNMDVELFINVAGKIEFRKNLLDIPFLNIGVPGVFTVGPEVQLDAAISYYEHEIAHLKFGFDYTMNYDFTVKSDNGLLSKPTISAVTPGVYNAHPYTYDKEYQIQVAAHLIPIIDIGAHIFGGDAFQLGVEMDNQIGLEFDTGSFNFCKTNELGIRLYEEIDINLYAKQLLLREEYNLWSYQKTLWTNCKAKPETTTINRIKTTAVATTTQTTVAVATTTTVVPTTTAVITSDIPVVITTTTQAPAVQTTTTPCDTTAAATTTPCDTTAAATTTDSPKVQTTTTPCDTTAAATTTDSPKVQTTTTPCDTTAAVTTTDSPKVQTTTTPCETTAAATTTDSPKVQTTTTPCDTTAAATTTDSPKVQTTPCDTTAAATTTPCETTTDSPKVQTTTTPCETTAAATTDSPKVQTTPCETTVATTTDSPKVQTTTTPCETTVATTDSPVVPSPAPGYNGNSPSAPSPVYTNTPSGDIPKVPTGYGNGNIPKVPATNGNGNTPTTPAGYGNGDIPKVPAVTTTPCEESIPQVTATPCATDIPVATTAPAYGGSGPIVSGASAISFFGFFVSLVALVL
ncbi:hypothetical protein HK103_006272 [Boothiomyces macroporosus]|uniref:DUF7029 domain-containing protein n=1 Tax=Boothiomyces macroporosus TaxID=261099 RepID=A0AAD5UHU9_9FUNG|nr:hypothetical protein HK103_006272 [Boothiomyces macroporosus]